MRYLVTFFVLAGLSGCGDPLAKIEKIDDVELAQDDAVVLALPTAAETEAEGGFLSRLIARAPADPDVVLPQQDAAAPVLPEGETTLAQGIASPSELPETQTVEAVVPEQGGLRGWLRRSADRSKSEETVAVLSPVVAVPTPAQVGSPDIVAEIVEAADIAPIDAPDVAVAVAIEPEKRKGLFGIFKPAEAETAQVRTASLSPDLPNPTADTLAKPIAEPAPIVSVEPKKRRGLFGGVATDAPRKGPDARDVDYGTVLAYGEVARVCGARGRPLGRKIDKAPARGRGYALFDSDPNATAPRTFYVTGFSDGCPRQFTAALALLGAPSLHEQLRYGRPSTEYPYSTTDKAYEKVKSSVCRVGKRKPCGAKISEMEKNTVFISTYERFGNNARWADILIHDGAVLAAAIKQP